MLKLGQEAEGETASQREKRTLASELALWPGGVQGWPPAAPAPSKPPHCPWAPAEPEGSGLQPAPELYTYPGLGVTMAPSREDEGEMPAVQ